jgi:hypothetical protein
VYNVLHSASSPGPRDAFRSRRARRRGRLARRRGVPAAPDDPVPKPGLAVVPKDAARASR